MSNVRISIPTPNGIIDLHIPDQNALFILGRNGTGKSALVHYINNQCRTNGTQSIIYIPGSRPSYFDSDSLSMTANSRSQYEINNPGWDASPDVRIRPISGTSKNERAIFDLQTAEIQYRVQAANEIEEEGIESPAIARLQLKISPLDRVNQLLQQANLPIKTIISSGELKAVRNDSTYSISKMSDGERTALIIIADVIAAKPDSIFLIDEPELHLHRAIVVPLLSSLLIERPDCTMIICTHELALANDHPNSQIVLVRSCIWSGNSPSAWTVDVLENSKNIPDDLRIDILGSRKIILFIEGESNSRDQQLYATIFPAISIRHRASCGDVRRATIGLNQVTEFHHASAFGLVDNDGMSIDFRAKLLEESVYALSDFSVESLYYASDVVSMVAARQGESLQLDPQALIETGRSKALSKLRQSGKIEHLAARVAERQMRDQIYQAFPNRDSIVANGNGSMSIPIVSPYPTCLERIRTLLETNDLDPIISAFPVRESGILGDIAESLRFRNESDYEKAALTVISLNPDLLKTLKAKLVGLSSHLDN